MKKQNLINIAVTFYKGEQQMTKEELEQLKKSNPSKEELDRINVKLKQINCWWQLGQLIEIPCV